MNAENSPMGATLKDCMGDSSMQPICYQLAGEEMVADFPLPSMAAYILRCNGEVLPRAGVSLETGAISGPAISTSGWLVGKDRKVTCSPSEAGYLLDLSGIGQFFIAKPHGHIACINVDEQISPAEFEEALLGPPVFYALATRNIWGLHVSGVVRDEKAVLFIGASGQGKSTLAAYLGKGKEGFQRIADDASPCSIEDGIVQVRPHFPQLKLNAAALYPLSAPGQLPVQAIVALNPDASERQPRLDRLKNAEALSVLLNQTIIVTLFDRALHQAHLLFLARLVEQSPVYRLSFPHDYDRLPEVGRLISDMAGD